MATIRKRKPKFKITMIFFIFLLSFILFFMVYMVSANRPDYNPKQFEQTASNSSVTSETTGTGETTTGTGETSQTGDTTAVSETTAGSDISQTTDTTTIQAVQGNTSNPVPESAPKTTDYYSTCAFVGDSITVGLASYALVPEPNVIASIGMNISKIDTDTIDTTYGNMKIIDALAAAQPQNVYIMLGSNGIAWLSNDVMIEKYSAFIDEIHATLPNATIYILSIPPVTAGREVAGDNAILNSEIDKYNLALLDLANTKGVNYVDINSALKGSDGKLPEEDAATDGMHFQKATYNILLNYVLSHTVSDGSEQTVTTTVAETTTVQ